MKNRSPASGSGVSAPPTIATSARSASIKPSPADNGLALEEQAVERVNAGRPAPASGSESATDRPALLRILPAGAGPAVQRGSHVNIALVEAGGAGAEHHRDAVASEARDGPSTRGRICLAPPAAAGYYAIGGPQNHRQWQAGRHPRRREYRCGLSL